ncbi:MAG: DUF697 domain-containing protein, partial [Cyanobacteria bacterium J06635_11]
LAWEIMVCMTVFTPVGPQVQPCCRYTLAVWPTAYAGAMTAQAGAAGYGTYAVGQTAKVYLQQGCTWGPTGVNTVMQTIISQAKADSTLERLQAEIKETIGNPQEMKAVRDAQKQDVQQKEGV